MKIDSASMAADLADIGASGSPTAVGRGLRLRNTFAERTSLILYNETDPDAVTDIVRAFKEASNTSLS